MRRLSRKQLNTMVLIFLSLIGLVIYSNTFDASFHGDDRDGIVFNEKVHMKEFSWQNLYVTNSRDNKSVVRPVAYMSFALNYYFGGLNVFGYHLVNIIIHIITGFGVYLLAKNTLELNESTKNKSSAVAALAALLWLTSAVQTQAVTYIIQRMASMAAMFYIYSLLLYIKGRVLGGRKMAVYIIAAAFLYLLALGTKQNAVTLPIIAILYEIAFLGSYRRYLGKAWLYLLLAAVLALSTTYVFLFLDLSDLYAYFSMGYGARERLFSGARVIVHYVTILLLPLPSKLVFFHDFPLSRGLTAPLATLPACIFVVSTMVLAMFNLKRYPLPAFLILWVFINLLPETLLMYLDLVYEHRLYLPSVGFYILFSLVLLNTAGFFRGRVSNGRWCLLFAVVFFFSAATYGRNMDWHDDLTLWQDNLKKTPMSSRVHEGVGMAYLVRGRLDEAEKELKIAKSINPLGQAALGLGIVHFNRGNHVAAFKEFEYVSARKKLGVDLIYSDADIIMYKIGEEFLSMGRIDDALKIFKLGLYINAENSDIRAALTRIEGRH